MSLIPEMAGNGLTKLTVNQHDGSVRHIFVAPSYPTIGREIAHRELQDRCQSVNFKVHLVVLFRLEAQRYSWFSEASEAALF